MKKLSTHQVAVLFWIALALALTVNCSIPLKQRISEGHQTVRAALVIFDDAERQLCVPDPPNPKHCTSSAAVTVGLTDAKHQAISKALAEAFDKDAKVSDAIIAWKAGDPTPTDLPTLLTDAQQTVSVVTGLAGSSGLLSKATDFLSRVQDLFKLFGGK